jgi:myo-inositol 2-dehydrogenase/D-chiro-inositol 1-dehydrogenase
MGRVHAENLARRIDGARLVAWADPSEADLPRLARELGVERVADHWREVVDADDVDALVVATPTDTHFEIVMAAAARRLAIFCEKPLDLRFDRLLAIRDEVSRRQVSLMVAFQRRFDPAFAALGRDIASGRIGRPHTLRIVSRDSRLPPEAFIPRSGGIFMDMAVHDFDMSRFLLGLEIEEVYARGSRLIDERFERHGDWDTTLISLRFTGGVLGSIENGRLASFGYDQRIEAFGSSGMLTVDNPPYALATGAGEVPFFAERYAEAYHLELQAFVNAVRAGEPPPAGVDSSLRAVEAALAAIRSVAENRPVRLDEIRDTFA